MKRSSTSLISVMAIASVGFLLPAFVSGETLVAADSTTGVQPDNTKKNVRDRDDANLTPADQARGSKADVKMTQRIRKAIMNDKSLSVNAKNIKIITLDGKTTLRGPVANADERERILKKAHEVAGAQNVTSELEVKNP